MSVDPLSRFPSWLWSFSSHLPLLLLFALTLFTVIRMLYTRYSLNQNFNIQPMWLTVGTVVLVIFSIDVINHHDQEQLREERGCFSLQLLGHTQSLREVRAGRNSIRNLGEE